MTASERGRKRLRAVFVTAFSSLVARAGSILVLLVTVPMSLEYLGPERFGMWMIISSLLALMTFADFGIGNGTLNEVAAAHGRNDDAGIRTAASNGVASMVAIALLISVSFAISYPFVAWERIFNVTSVQATAEAGPAVAALIICLVIGLPGAIAPKVHLGLQQGYLANIWAGIGGLLSLIGVILAIRLEGGVFWMTAGLFGGMQIAVLANYVHIFHFQRRDLAPSAAYVSRAHMQALFRVGGAFFLLQLIALVTFRLDAIIVAQFFGTTEAGSFAVYERLFSLVLLIATVLLTPLWPAYGEAISRRDVAWVKRIVLGSLVIAIIGTTVLAGGIALFSDFLVPLWVGKAIEVSMLLIIGMAVLKVLEAAGTALAMFMNGAGMIRIQLYLAAGMGLCALILKVGFSDQIGMWVIPWMTSVSYFFIIVIPTLFLIKNMIRNI